MNGLELTSDERQLKYLNKTKKQLLFENDTIRKWHDIRNAIESELLPHQKVQLKAAKNQIEEYKNYQLRKAIFRTDERWRFS